MANPWHRGLGGKSSSVPSLPVVGRYLVQSQPTRAPTQRTAVVFNEDRPMARLQKNMRSQALQNARGRNVVRVRDLGPSATRMAKPVMRIPVGVKVDTCHDKRGISSLLVAALSDMWEKWGMGKAWPRHFFDLGCGDGRVLLDVCKAFPTCTGTGMDSDACLIEKALLYTKQDVLEARCNFQIGDAGASCLANATAVLLSLPGASLNRFFETLLLKGGLRPGALLFRVGIALPSSPYLRELLTFFHEEHDSQNLFCYVLRDAEIIQVRMEESMLLVQRAARRYLAQFVVNRRVQEHVALRLQAAAKKYLSQQFLEKLRGEAIASAQLIAMSDTNILSRWSQLVFAYLQCIVARRRLRCPKGVGRLIKVQPNQIFFAKRSIAERFACGRTIASTIEDLQNGVVLPRDIPTISIIRRGGRFLTLNHRRLYAFQKALPEQIMIEAWFLDREIYVDRQIPEDCRGYRAVSIDHAAVG